MLFLNKHVQAVITTGPQRKPYVQVLENNVMLHALLIHIANT
jgi:hypothetical protein